MRNTFRHGDTMIAVESQPATIAFDDLLAATRVIDDTDNGEAPWENWDGWEHTAKPPRAFDHADVREMQGYACTSGRGERYVIQLPAGDTDGVYRYARERGASRQVAAEALAAARRQTIAQLEKAGFTVTGKPEHRQGLSRTEKQERIRRNLTAQNWAA